MTETANRPAPPVQPAQKPVQTRRVGTLTMGVALIAAGILITAAVVMPGLNLSFIAKCSPLLLVLLGCEVLWFSVRSKDERIRYDLLSMVVCVVVIFSCFLISLIPTYIRYYGPDREVACQRLSSELDQKCYELLGEDERVLRTTGSVYLTGLEPSYDLSLTTLDESAYLSVTVEMAGLYENRQDFAAACADLRNELGRLPFPLDSVHFRWYAQNPADGVESAEMDLTVEGPYLWNADAARLADSVNDHTRYLEVIQSEDAPAGSLAG